MINMNGISVWRFAVIIIIKLFPLATQTSAFTSIKHTPNRLSTIKTNPTASTLNLQRPVGGRHFQLEELEDSESASTDVLLNSDLTVTLGETDGPRYISSEGTWSESCQYQSDDQSQERSEFKRFFTMKLKRRFIAGSEKEDGSGTNMGEFEYDVERRYDGECFLVGGTVFAMNGEIVDVDEIFGERRVGFFNMIDTTDEREDIDSLE